MMPSPTPSDRPIVGYQPDPARITLESLLTQTTLGPKTLGDAADGINYQLWTITCQSDGIVLRSADGQVNNILPSITNCTEVSFTFDQSGKAVITYWYDTSIHAYTTTSLSSGNYGGIIQIDERRPVLIANSDDIWCYMRKTGSSPDVYTAFYRYQRDRYGIEYTFGPCVGPWPRIAKFSMNNKWRMQLLAIPTNRPVIFS
jgi:hypothetical protein